MRPTTRRLAPIVAFAALAATAALPATASGATRHEPGRAGLVQFAQLPAMTFVSGSEPSGALLGTAPINGITPPFADQPLQGFSGIVRNADGTFEVLSDNGYGAKNNSADFILRINRIAPDFGRGTIDVVGGINLTDPYRKVPFALTRPDRVLTGNDLDPESIVRVADGTYWIGDEFGPFLLHFDRAGRLLDAPVPLPGVFAPENPLRGEIPANLGSSRGFEGMTRSPDGKTLYPLLEGTVAGEPAGKPAAQRVRPGRPCVHRQALGLPARSADGTRSVTRRWSTTHRLLVIERDNGEGAAAKFKRIYLADLRDRDHDGKLDKTLVADLLDIANPKGVGGFGDPFRFPFTTIEDVLILDDRTLAVLNDNNFPFSAGRTPGQPDNDEFIVIRLADRLRIDKRVLR